MIEKLRIRLVFVLMRGNRSGGMSSQVNWRGPIAFGRGRLKGEYTDVMYFWIGQARYHGQSAGMTPPCRLLGVM